MRPLLDTLIENLQERYAGIDDKIVKSQQYEENTLARAVENEKTWSKAGFASILLGKRNKLLDAQAIIFEELYIYKTQIVGHQFFKALLSEIIEQINGLKSQIDRANQTLDSSFKESEKNISERCNDDEDRMNVEEYYKQQVIRFYDSEKVKNTTKRFIRDKKEQGTQTYNVRKALTDRLGDQPNFSVFNERINKSALINTLELVCDQNAKNAEASLDQKDRLFDIGIVGKLKERFDGNYDELRRYIKRLVDYSGCFISFNQNEVNKTGDGVKSPPTKIKSFTIVIPKDSENQVFLDELERAFRETAPAGLNPDFVYTESKKFEIVLLSLVNGFPLRYIYLVEILRKKYEDRINKDDSAKAKMFLHTEGNGENLPKLFVPTQAEMEVELEHIRQDSVQFILLAYAMGFIKEKVNSQGYSKLAFVKPDQFGDMVPVFFMDEKLSECYQSFDRKKLETIESFIKPKFEEEFKFKTKKESLKEEIIKLIKFIKDERGNEDNTYALHKSEASSILERLN